MKKVIKFKTKSLTEDNRVGYKGDQGTVDKIDRRVIKALRTAEAARQAAANARQNGQDDLAADLEARAKELEEWADIENNKYRSQDDQGKSNSDEKSDIWNFEEPKQNPESEEDEEEGELGQEAEQNVNNQGSGTAQKDGSKANNGQNDGKESDTKGDEPGDKPEDEPGDGPSKPAEEPGKPDKPGKGQGKPGKGPGGDPGDPVDGPDGDPGDFWDDIDDESESDDDEEDGDGEDEGDGDPVDDIDDGPDGPDGGPNKPEQIKNPFDIDPKQAKKNQQEVEDEPEEKPEDEFEAMKKILKMLKGGEKAGAKKGLEDILSGRGVSESLQESVFKPITKDITDIDDGEFNEIINDTLDIINKVKPVNISTDVESRIKEIETDNNNPDLNKELEDEDRKNIEDERNRFKAAKKELERYKVRDSGGAGNEAFKKMLRQAIKNQVAKLERDEDAWGELNRRHQDDDILAPGIRPEEIKKKGKVSIQMYMDCSGSFTESDIIKERAFLGVVNDFVQKGKVDIDLIYFADNLHSTFAPAKKEHTTAAWKQIIDNIIKTKPDNVIIITDWDMNGDCDYYGKTYTAKGCVWYIWKRADAPALPKHVRGLKGTYEYWLD